METKIIIICGFLLVATVLLGWLRLWWLRKCYDKARAEHKEVSEREQLALADKQLRTFNKARSATWKYMGIALVVIAILGTAVWGVDRISKASRAEKEQAKLEEQVKPEKEVSLSLFGWFISRFSYDKALEYHTEKAYSAKEKALAKYKEFESLLQSEQKQGNAKATSIAMAKLVEAKFNLDEAEQKVNEIPEFYAKWLQNSLLNYVNGMLFLYGILLLIAIKFSKGEFLFAISIIGVVLCAGALIFFGICFGSLIHIFTWRTFLLLLLCVTDIYLATKVKWDEIE